MNGMRQGIRALLREEQGQAAVLFGLMAAVILGVGALVIDIGMVDYTRQQLQSAADAAAIAAAYELPSSAAAATTARQYAGRNHAGNAVVTVTTPYKGSPDKVEVVCTKTVRYSIARILGLTETEVSARAVAMKSGGAGPLAYAVFNGDPGHPLNFWGGDNVIGGSVHSNSSVTFSGSNQNVSGTVEAVQGFTLYGSNEHFGGVQASSITAYGDNQDLGTRITSPAANVPMLDFSAEIRAAAEAAGNLYTGDVVFNGCSVDVSSPIYIDGNLQVNGDTFSGRGVILVTGNITFNGSNISSSGGAVCFYSSHGNITIHGDRATMDGLVYAPNGTITIDGSYTVIRGSLVGYRLVLNGSYFTVQAQQTDIPFLPKLTVKLSE